MKITVNGSPVTVGGEIKTLKSLISTLKKDHIDSQDLITKIVIDEKEVDISESNFPLTDSSTIALVSEPPRQLAKTSIENLQTHITQILPSLEKSADKFRTEGEEEANKYYSDCLGALQLFSELIDGVSKMLDLDYSKIHSKDGRKNDDIIKTQKLFEAMHEAQTQKDWILLADVIEYELTPVMKNWLDGLPAILAYIQNQK
ncbi:MAG: hypothetical protein ACE5FU_12915 [Nitrospinota bacterium]